MTEEVEIKKKIKSIDKQIGKTKLLIEAKKLKINNMIKDSGKELEYFTKKTKDGEISIPVNNVLPDEENKKIPEIMKEVNGKTYKCHEILTVSPKKNSVTIIIKNQAEKEIHFKIPVGDFAKVFIKEYS